MEEKLAEIKRQMAAKRKGRGAAGTKSTKTAQVDANANNTHGFQECEDNVESAHELETELQSMTQDSDSKSDTNTDTSSDTESQDSGKFEFTYQPEEMELQYKSQNSDAKSDTSTDTNTDTESQDSDKTEYAYKPRTKLQSEIQNTDPLSQDSGEERLDIPLLPEIGTRNRNFPSGLNNTNNPNSCPTTPKLRTTITFPNLNCTAALDAPRPFDNGRTSTLNKFDHKKPNDKDSLNRMPENKAKERPDVPPILRNGGYGLRKRSFPTEFNNTNKSNSTIVGPELRNTRTFLDLNFEAGPEAPTTTEKGSNSKKPDHKEPQNKGIENKKLGNKASNKCEPNRQNLKGKEINSQATKNQNSSKVKPDDKHPKINTPGKEKGSYKNCNCCIGLHLLKAGSSSPTPMRFSKIAILQFRPPTFLQAKLGY